MLSTQIFEHINPDIKKILNSALNSEELSVKDGIKLLKVTGKEFIALQIVANQICFEKKENIVTFVKNRNINFTNICYQKCKFCSFSVPKTDKNAFLLLLDETLISMAYSLLFDIILPAMLTLYERYK